MGPTFRKLGTPLKKKFSLPAHRKIAWHLLISRALSLFGDTRVEFVLPDWYERSFGQINHRHYLWTECGISPIEATQEVSRSGINLPKVPLDDAACVSRIRLAASAGHDVCICSHDHILAVAALAACPKPVFLGFPEFAAREFKGFARFYDLEGDFAMIPPTGRLREAA